MGRLLSLVCNDWDLIEVELLDGIMNMAPFFKIQVHVDVIFLCSEKGN